MPMLGSTFSKPRRLPMLAFSELVRPARGGVLQLGGVGHRDFHRDHIADMHGARIVKEALRARLPQRVVGMGDRRGARNFGHDLGACGIADRRKLGGFADISNRSNAEQADSEVPIKSRVEN